ncbi:MAG: hypothetical protein JNK25_07845 [Phycisphaerae bacterium]|nr:hypothetical protein [Phycisphaerae bacterium]
MRGLFAISAILLQPLFGWAMGLCASLCLNGSGSCCVGQGQSCCGPASCCAATDEPACCGAATDETALAWSDPGSGLPLLWRCCGGDPARCCVGQVTHLTDGRTAGASRAEPRQKPVLLPSQFALRPQKPMIEGPLRPSGRGVWPVDAGTRRAFLCCWTI